MPRLAALLLALLLLAGCPDGPPPPPPAPRYSLHLREVGADVDGVVAAVASIRGGSHTLARKLVERKPADGTMLVAADLSEAEARAAAAALEAAGAKAQVVEVSR